MSLKVSSILSDKKFYHLLFPKKLTIFIDARNYCYLQKNRHNFIRRRFVLSSSRVPEMSTDETPASVFSGKEDRFHGITVKSEEEPCNSEEFAEKLKKSLSHWTSSKKRAIWFRVHLRQSDWVPILVKNGFKYHHAQDDYVMLNHWLPTDESDNIPPFAHTMLGVGAVVENEKNEILVVQEKYTNYGAMWKMPGGYVEPGENLVDAAIREVQEETGITAEFQSLLTWRHTHYGMFGCSDIYFVVSLRALSSEIDKCNREIAECKWMKIEEYMNHPKVHDLNKFLITKLLHHKKHNLKIDCHHGVHQLLQKPFTVYSVAKADDKEEDGKIPWDSITSKPNNL